VVVVAAVLAALPALVGGLLPWAGGRVEAPFAVQVPSVTIPGNQSPAPAPTPAPTPARDRDGNDSSGSGRSGGGGGGSSGPG
jgi:hypothetical protein